MMNLAIYVMAHVVGGVAGFWLIARMARSTLSDRRFWVVTGLLTVGMGLFLLSISEPPRFFKDFYTAYFAAGEAVLTGPEALRPQLEKGVNGFVNLPIVAYLFAPFALLPFGAAGPAMASRGWGRIVIASSIGVKFGGGTDSFNYALANHASEFIPRTARDWAASGVLTNVVRIGVTDTKAHDAFPGRDLARRAELIPMKRAATTAEIADYLFWIGSESNTYLTGQVNAISGGE